MELLLEREHFADEYTIGKLYTDKGEYLCDTLEDRVREGEKVYGSTAIPKGRYPLTWCLSNRFKKYLPLLGDVPNFSGVRIHTGNTHEDTEGCILVGMNKLKGRVIDSRVTFDRIKDYLRNATHITIE